MSFPKSKSLHYNEAVQRYFAHLEREGHDLKDFMYILNRPGGIPPNVMVRFAHHIGADFGDLLSNGIGRNNDYDALDRAVRESQPGYCLAPVEVID